MGKVQSFFQIFFRELKTALFESDLQRIISSLALQSALSFAPLLAVVFFVADQLGQVESFWLQAKKVVFRYVTAGAGKNLFDGFEEAVNQMQRQRGWVGLFGLLLLIWTSTRLMDEVDDGLKRIWAVKERKAFWRRLVFYALALVLAPVAVTALLSLLSHMVVGDKEILNSVRWMLLGVLWLVVSLVYHFAPKQPLNYWMSFVSGALAAVGFVGIQNLYVAVASGILNYNKIYGSIAIIPLFLLWLSLVWTLFMVGALFSKSLYITRRSSAPGAL